IIRRPQSAPGATPIAILAGTPKLNRGDRRPRPYRPDTGRHSGGRRLMNSGERIGKLALLVGGGPAPGINGVISAVTIEAVNNGMEVLGIRDGFKYLVAGRTDRVRRLTIDDVKGIPLRGGSVLGTSRTNPTKSAAEMDTVLGT